MGPNLDLLHFFPDDLTAQPGDTVERTFGMQNTPVPHSIIFLNGADAPGDVIPVPWDNGPTLLVYTAGFLFPGERRTATHAGRHL